MLSSTALIIISFITLNICFIDGYCFIGKGYLTTNWFPAWDTDPFFVNDRPDAKPYDNRPLYRFFSILQLFFERLKSRIWFFIVYKPIRSNY